MAIAETARLLASLELQDKFSGTIRTVEGKLDNVGSKLDGIGDKAKTKFGTLRDAAKDTNTQIGFVNGALNVVEQFVPPSIRPLVDGLEDLNNIAPKGLLGLLAAGGSSLSGAVSSVATSVATAAAGTGLSALAASLAVAALPIFAAEAVLWLTTPAEIAAENLAARRATAAARGIPVESVPTGDRSKPLSAVPSWQWNTVQPVVDKETRDALTDQLAAANSMNDTLRDISGKIKPPPPPIINLQTKVVILGQTVTTQYSRYTTANISALLP